MLFWMTAMEQRNDKSIEFVKKVLICDPDINVMNNLESFINTRYPAIEVFKSNSSEDAYSVYAREFPDVVVADFSKVENNGLKLYKKLKNEVFCPYFIALVNDRTDSEVLDFIKYGVDDYCRKPFSELDFLTKLTSAFRIASFIKKQETHCKMDTLTGLPNRKHFNEKISQEWASSVRDGRDIALLIIDIDFFKRVNDTFGHEVGDRVISAVGSLIKGSLRLEDTVCRWGGEEFAIIISSTSKEGVILVGDKIIQLFNERNVLKEILPNKEV